MGHWSQEHYDGYDAVMERRTFVRDLYTGDALYEARERAEEIAEDDLARLQRLSEEYEGTQFDPEPDLGQYLFRRAQGENTQAFYERARLSRQPGHLAQIVDRQVGAVQLAGYEVDSWADEDGNGPLGDPSENGSIADQVTADVNGRGVSWSSFMTNALTRMMLNSSLDGRSGVWVLVEGPTREGLQRPTAHVVALPAIVDTYSKGGRLTDVIVKEEVSTRGSIKEAHDTEEQYIHYHTEGYDRYDAEGARLEEESAEWENRFYATPDQEQEVLPLFRVNLGLPRDVVRQVAEGEQYLFNLLSDIRMAGRIASHPRLVGDVDDQEFDNTKDALLQGQNVLQGDWRYEILDWGALKQAREMYHAEAAEYYKSSFQQLNDVARESTATEIRQRDANGRQAFLQHLSQKADDIDNRIRFLMAQIEAPGAPDQWGIPAAKRSTEYTPTDPEALAQKKAETLFGSNAVPADQGTLTNAAASIIEDLGVEIADREALSTAVAVRPSRRQSSGALQQLRDRIGASQQSDT